MAAITSAVAKVLWRQELRSVRWIVLSSVSGLAILVVDAVGLVTTGREAKMGVYAAMVVACAASQWWVAHRR